jgi:hypothetical protein
LCRFDSRFLSFIRFLIGRNGSNIRKIRELTGARIVFPSDSEANNTKERDIITIVGREDAVKKAREELESRIKELVSRHILINFLKNPMF